MNFLLKKVVLSVVVIISFSYICSISSKANNYEDIYDYSEIDKLLDDINSGVEYEEAVENTIKDGGVDYKKILPNIGDKIADEWESKKTMILKLVAIVIITAIFTNFSDILGSSYVTQTSFMVVYMILIVALVNSFIQIYQVAQKFIDVLKNFMGVMCPVYGIATLLANGIKSATAWNVLTMMLLTVIEVVFFKIIIPGVFIYMIIMLVNGLGEQETLGRIGKFIELIINWSLKGVMLVIASMGTIQRVIAPAVDKGAKSVISNSVKLAPFIGKHVALAGDTVASATSIVKGAIGGVSMVTIVVICISPLISIGVYMLVYEIVAMMLESIADKRVVAALGAASNSAKMLFGITLTSGMVCIIAIALLSV